MSSFNCPREPTQKEAEVSLLVVIALEKIYKRALLRTVKDPTKRFGTLNSSIRVLNFAISLFLYFLFRAYGLLLFH